MTQFQRPQFNPNAAAARHNAPAPQQQSIFARLAAAGTSVQSNWLRAGEYIFRIDEVKNERTQMGKEAFFIKHTTVHVFDNDQGRGHSVGEECTQAYWFHHKGYLERFNTAMIEITTLPKEELSEQMLEQILVQNLLGGVYVHWRGSQKQRQGKEPLTIGKYGGVISGTQLKEVLTEQEVHRFFPGGALDQMIAAEQAESPASAQPAAASA